jgi:hypothetical protein
MLTFRWVSTLYSLLSLIKWNVAMEFNFWLVFGFWFDETIVSHIYRGEILSLRVQRPVQSEVYWWGWPRLTLWNPYLTLDFWRWTDRANDQWRVALLRWRTVDGHGRESTGLDFVVCNDLRASAGLSFAIVETINMLIVCVYPFQVSCFAGHVSRVYWGSSVFLLIRVRLGVENLNLLAEFHRFFEF